MAWPMRSTMLRTWAARRRGIGALIAVQTRWSTKSRYEACGSAVAMPSRLLKATRVCRRRFQRNELVEITVEMRLAQSVIDTGAPSFQVGEHSVNQGSNTWAAMVPTILASCADVASGLGIPTNHR